MLHSNARRILALGLAMGVASPAFGTSADRLAATRALKGELEVALKDYPSARFRDIRMWQDAAGDWLACGFVNSKNSYGGYTGWVRFLGGPRKGGGAVVTLAEGPLEGAFESACAETDKAWTTVTLPR